VGGDDGFYAGGFELCEHGVQGVEGPGVVGAEGVLVVGDRNDG